MSDPYPNLFSPLDLGAHRLRNRVSLPATLTNFGAANRVTPRWTNFLVERARGGCALLVSEIIAVDPEALAHGAIVTGYDDANDEGFRRTADGVESAGGVLVGQLWHPGRQQLWHPTRSPQGVSDQPDALSWTVPHVMDADELARLETAFVDTAVRLARCGFHGVELHGAHGYLLTQLLSPWSNTRSDTYGGSRENRVRFVRQVAERVRERCGDGFIIGLKMPADEGVEGGIDPDEAEGITAHLAAHGVLGLLRLRSGQFQPQPGEPRPGPALPPGALHRPSPPHAGCRRRYPGDGPGTHRHRRPGGTGGGRGLRRPGGPVPRPDLRRGLCPQGPGGPRGGHPALRVQQLQLGRGPRGQAPGGVPQSHLGEDGEARWSPSRAAVSKRVVVVGSGPGGLEAAWVAAARGHRVILLGAGGEAGGKSRLEARLPGHGEMAKVYQHQLHMARHHGVELVLGETAVADTVLAQGPDVVIVATGARMREPENVAIHGHQALSAHAFAAAWNPGAARRDTTAVLYDHDHTAGTYAVAEALALSHQRLVLITPRTQIAQAVNYCSALGVHRRLHGLGVEIVTASEPVSWRAGVLTLVNVFSQREREIRGVETFVYATPRRADDALLGSLRGRVPVHGVGDCVAPRNMLIAIHEGHHVGNSV